MYYTPVGRGLEFEFQVVRRVTTTSASWFGARLPAAHFLTGSTAGLKPLLPPHNGFAGRLFRAFRQRRWLPRPWEALKEVAGRAWTQARPRVALSWCWDDRPSASVIIAARKIEQLEDNIRAVDLQLSTTKVPAFLARGVGSGCSVSESGWSFSLDTAEIRVRRSCSGTAMRCGPG